MCLFDRQRHSQQAQAATELAVFGAIIIFIIGSIVRSSLLTGYQQNTQLKSMRHALLISYQTSVRGEVNGAFVGQKVGRNNSSFAYIEDRLSPEAGKYGPQEREQFFATGSGTMTNRLQYPVDESDAADPANLPVMDFFINGKFFQFTTAALVTININPPPGYAASYDIATTPDSVLDPTGKGTYHYHGWNFKCLEFNDQWYGCPIFYEPVPRGAKGFCPPECGAISMEERYDLNRNDIYTDDPMDCSGLTKAPLSKTCQEDISWQWNAVMGVQGSINVDKENGNYPLYDVDNDGKEETVFDLYYDDMGIVRGVRAMDSQEGDIDPSNKSNGLKSDMAIYTRTRGGTYLLLKEGKMYNLDSSGSQRFVRSASAKDQVEIVERVFVLNRDTGNLCDGAGHPSPFNGSVESCNDCFGAHRQWTCFDQSSKRLYIRSRVWDKGGRFWKTDTTGGLP